MEGLISVSEDAESTARRGQGQGWAWWGVAEEAAAISLKGLEVGLRAFAGGWRCPGRMHPRSFWSPWGDAIALTE